jgi:exodeoxyribonuclease VII small subunit
MTDSTPSQRPPTDAEVEQAQLTFEQAIARLESIIEGVESGEVGLEASLAQYEQGMKLIRHCRGILDRAQTQIEKLTVPDDVPAGDEESTESAESADETEG